VRLRDRELAEKLRGAANAEALHVVLTSDTWRGKELGNFLTLRRDKRNVAFGFASEIHNSRRTMLSFATFRRGLCHAGNLIAGN
jgi:hypothetical protein